MNYVMSDIYGDYDRFEDMLDKIELGDDDNLYILGNVVGGEGSVQLLEKLAESVNIYPIMGECDKAAADVLTLLMNDLEGGDPSALSDETKQAAAKLSQLGGRSVLEEFVALSPDKKSDLLDFLAYLPQFEICDTDSGTFILVPRGLGNFDEKGKKLKKYTFEELALTDVDYERKFFDDDSVYIVSGGVPAGKLCGENRVYKSNNNICINGDLRNGGRLICLCLDTMEEFYVE